MPHLVGDKNCTQRIPMGGPAPYAEWVNDGDITQNLHDIFLFPNTLYETESFLRSMIEGQSGSKGFIIAVKETLSYIGLIDLHQIDYRN